MTNNQIDLLQGGYIEFQEIQIDNITYLLIKNFFGYFKIIKLDYFIFQYLIVSGVSNYNNNKILVEIERSKAIEEAKKNSEEGDIVLIAGKGHEDYQILKNKVIKFDDFKIAKKIFNK